MAERVVCLLPARNATAFLPEWFDAVAPIADAVVALDDGSTDATRAALEAHPLVRTVLENPVRPTYAGWDDAANRRRLVEAAGALEPQWIVQLDADERLPPDDAIALRRFLLADADHDAAYLLRVFRMVGDHGHYDPAGTWVARVFGWRPGLRLPTARLHLVPVPESIPPTRRFRTTFRIQHLASIDGDARRRRFDKHEAADPDHRFQRTYRNLLAPPGAVRPWRPRPPDLPDLQNGCGPAPPLLIDGPAVSVVIIAQDDEAVISQRVAAALAQELAERIEVIVVTSGSDRTASIVRDGFPGVILVELPRPVLPGAARNAGLRVATGLVVTFPGSHCELRPGALAAMLAAHRQGWAMVAGTMRNGTTRTTSGWASYFLDNSTVLPGRPSGPLAEQPIRASFLREPLAAIGGFPADVRAGEDATAIRELWDLGYGACRATEAEMTHDNVCSTPARLLRHQYVRGRAFGRLLVEDAARRPTAARRFGFDHHIAWFIATGVPARLRAIATRVHRWAPELQGRFLRSAPLVAAAAVSYWFGACVELGRRRVVRRSRSAGAARVRRGA